MTTTTTRSRMKVRGRTLLYSVLASVVLFVVAAPLGDSTHGIGEHHPAVADVGNVVFAIFGLSVLVLIGLLLVLVAQTVLSRARAE